ncbi:DUF5994 family protein [Streptacidiphilus fuscans]|nr:DUF5994 family protein [Streptacidiphilus fuscans]
MSVSLFRPSSVALPLPGAEFRTPRLALRPHGEGGGLPRGALAGAWWPRSDDLLRELPSLIALLDRTWGRVTRVEVDPTHWQSLPRAVPVPGHIVTVGRCTVGQNPHHLLLLSYRARRWNLLVVPPRTSRVAAARLMAAATVAGRRRTDDRFDASADVRPPGDVRAEAAWESEGGAPLSVPLITPTD